MSEGTIGLIPTLTSARRVWTSPAQVCADGVVTFKTSTLKTTLDVKVVMILRTKTI